MDRWVGKVALVTGASSGIGAATCRKLVEQGLVVVGCARSVEKIESLADELKSARGALNARQCDLTQENEILALFQWIKSTLGGVDICINNAGLGDDGSLLGPEANAATWKNMLDVNVIALCLCTKEAVASMRERGVDDGQVIHIGSMAGHRIPVRPNNHFYCATKFAIRALLECHRQELRALNSHIRVSAISPGLVDTNFFTVASHGDTHRSQQLFATVHPIAPEDVADAVLYILGTPPHVQVHDLLMRPTEQKY